MYSLVEYNGNPFLAKITVEEYGNGSKRAYNVERIKMSASSRAQYFQIKSAYRGNFASNADKISVADLHSLVKQFDSNFNPKAVNSILLNHDDTPKTFYHSTNENFTDFKTGNGTLGKEIYFSDYSQQIYGRNIIKVFLKAENPVMFSKLPKGAREVNSEG